MTNVARKVLAIGARHDASRCSRQEWSPRIALAGRALCRFTPRHRAERGIDVSYETIRCWVNKFGPAIDANIRRVRGRADSIWHLDEMVVRINGKR